jgi:Flp pilus assembly protein TadB
MSRPIPIPKLIPSTPRRCKYAQHEKRCDSHRHDDEKQHEARLALIVVFVAACLSFFVVGAGATGVVLGVGVLVMVVLAVAGAVCAATRVGWFGVY